MPFLDEVDLEVAAGSGGRGAVSFRREKYVPAGGPDGGDGGRGGHVVLIADAAETTLSRYRVQRRFAAENGRPGEAGNRTGGDGEDLALPVPAGTVVHSDTGTVADLVRTGDRVVVARGGEGGRGNARFATSTRQAPRNAELGERGEQQRIHLELKLIADIGLVGLPNAGKSTLLAALTGAHPKIAAYPFTTLHPNLGVAELSDGRAVVLADVPGIIAGASQGAGLGTDFLRHLERTRALVHVVDMSNGIDAARAAMTAIDQELRTFSAALAERASLLAFNKVDLPAGAAAATDLAREYPKAFLISALRGEGGAALLSAASELVDAARDGEAEVAPPGNSGQHRLYRHQPRRNPFMVSREGTAFRVSGTAVERLVQMTDLENDEAVAVLQRRLRRNGVDGALAKAGCVDGDTVRIGDAEFIFNSGDAVA